MEDKSKILLAKRTERVQESATLAMAQKALELQQKGIDVISLSLGEPDFNTPESIKMAAIEAVEKNYSHYSPVSGFLSLKQAICQKLKRDNHLDFLPEQIVVANGAKQALYQIFQVLIDEQDEVILPAPYWVSYATLAQISGANLKVVNCEMEQNFKISPEQLAAAITPKTKLFVLNSPSNPTGAVYSQAEIEALAEVLKKHPQIWILSDEIYEYIRFTDKKHFSIAQIPEFKSRVLLVHGVSKGYAMTGYRIGFSATPTFIAKACTALQSQISSGACSVAQKAAEKAFNLSEDIAEDMRNTFKKRRDLAVQILQSIPGLELQTPEGAFYLFPRIKQFFGKKFENYHIQNSKDLCLYLLDQAHVAMVDGESFGAQDYVRLSYAIDEKKLEQACQHIKNALLKLY